MAEARGDIITHSTNTDANIPAWLRERLSWFMDLKFGVILHWGPYSQWDCYESWPLVPADTWARPDTLKEWNDRGRDIIRFQKDYWDLNRTFNPVQFDPEQWADVIAGSGARYAALTTKHHDGFCLWDTRTSDYRITHPSCPFSSHPRADIIRAAFNAFRSRGLAISCYFSKSDWKHPSYWSPEFPIIDRHPNYDTLTDTARWERFVQYVHSQIRELMSDYGPIDVLWLDGGQVRPPKQDIRMQEIARFARELQPGLIIADRTVGGEFENIITPEGHLPEKPLDAPWESCIPAGRNWKYVTNEEYRSVPELIRMLAEAVAKNGNLMLGVGPTPDGIIDEEAASRLRGIGDWMHVNGDAIYGTRALAPYVEGNLFYTQKQRRKFIIAFPENGRFGETIPLGTIRPANNERISLIGGGSLTVRTIDGSMHVLLPEKLPSAHAIVLELHSADI